MTNIQMTYDKTVRISPFGKCWSPNLTKSEKKFEHPMYSVTLGIDRDDPTAFDPIRKTLNDFAKAFSDSLGGMKVENKIIYISDKGNASIRFNIRDKGQGAVPCYNEDGEPTEAPIDGDIIQVKYSLAGWTMGGKAGIKVYLDSVVVVERSGKPKKEPPPESNEDDDDWLT